MNIQMHNLLKDWLAFASDVQVGDAAGAYWLNALRARTEAQLQKLNISQNSGKPIVSGSACDLLRRLKEANMCSVIGDELIDEFLQSQADR
jgi:hypothetical protein